MPDPVTDPGTAPGNQPPGQSDWRPEEFRSEKSLESFKATDGETLVPVPKGLVKSFVEAQKMIGGSVRIPKDDAPPEEWEKFYSKVGRPESPDKYEIAKPNLPEGMAWDEDLVKSMSATAHKLGLTKKQLNGLLESYNGHQAEKFNKFSLDVDKERNETLAALEKDWGPNLKKNVAMAAGVVLRYGGVDLQAALDKAGMGNNPALVRALAKIGYALGEDHFIASDTPGSTQSAMEQIKAIQNDPKHPFWNEGPGHKEAVELWTKLHKQAYGQI